MTTHQGTDWSHLDADIRDQAQRDEKAVRRGFWRKLQRNAAAVPFAEDAVTAYFAAFDRDTPLKVRAGLMGALAYFLMPADMVPDFLPVLGFGDDAAVLIGAIKLLASNIQPHHRDAARATLDDMKAPGP
ncbi:YkvA family protein [Aquabacter cavernae]|uniref:YkvA family protein n=1 Tax=Aquabacter cavernae TaxID=2496029 RepID=UPI000F8C71B7|nr:YkvA family protein [Aquabacter cavernae]